jgi:DNA-binding transcriptional regulator YhcF (GntR family)
MSRQNPSNGWKASGGGFAPIGGTGLEAALSKLQANIATDGQTTNSRPFGKSGAGGFQAAKESWLKVIASYPNLSGSDCAVAIAISIHLNSKKGEAWPSIETLAFETNRNRATVWRSIERLSKLRLLSVRKGRGRNISNRYRPSLGDIDCDPRKLHRNKKTLRTDNNNTANSQQIHCESAERT